MMNVYVRDALSEMATAFKFVKDYKENGNPLHLLTAGEHRNIAYRYLFTAKEWISEEEWKIWDEIYWDFRWDLDEYVIK